MKRPHFRDSRAFILSLLQTDTIVFIKELCPLLQGKHCQPLTFVGLGSAWEVAVVLDRSVSCILRSLCTYFMSAGATFICALLDSSLSSMLYCLVCSCGNVGCWF